jgi:hypothetical protein
MVRPSPDHMTVGKMRRFRPLETTTKLLNPSNHLYSSPLDGAVTKPVELDAAGMSAGL